MSFTASLSEVVQENANGLLGAHPTWVKVRLGDIAQILNGFAFPSSRFSQKEGKPLLRIRDIFSNETEAFYEGEYDSMYLLQPNDLVIGMDGDFNCALWKGPEALLNQRVCKLTVEEDFYSRKLLAYVLPGYLSAINAKTSSVTVKHLSSYTVADIPLPLPPFHEQHRIVTKIEELITKLNAGVEALEKIKAQLKRYRQAVLKHAFEGKLTEGWREVHKYELESAPVLLERVDEERKKNIKGKFKEPLSVDTKDLSELPEGWIWARFNTVCSKIQDGSHFSPNVQFPTPAKDRYLYITAKNIKEDGIDLSNVTYTDYAFHKSIYERCNPEYGDVLLIKDGVKTGVATVNNITDEFSLLSSVALFKTSENVLSSHYLAHFLNSPTGFEMITGQMTGTAIKRIILDKLRLSYLPLPPLAEQQKIVEGIERQLSIVNEAEKVVEQCVKWSQRLRQSILKKTFEGELVPQNPSDEPAEKLLERIREEKEKQKANEKAATGKNPKQLRMV